MFMHFSLLKTNGKYVHLVCVLNMAAWEIQECLVLDGTQCPSR